MESVLKIENLNFNYENSDSNIFKNFNLDIKKGEFVSLLGASGSGKTTLLRILAGLEKAKLNEISKKDIKITYMPQRDSLLPWRNILNNIILPLEIEGINKKEAAERAEFILKKLSLEKWMLKYPRELSGGMRQRISFARTLISEGDLLLLDEPFSALDSITKISLREWLKDIITSIDKSFLLVTHDIEEAIELSDRIFVIRGTPVEDFKEFIIEKDIGSEEKSIIKKRILDVIRGQEDEI